MHGDLMPLWPVSLPVHERWAKWRAGWILQYPRLWYKESVTSEKETPETNQFHKIWKFGLWLDARLADSYAIWKTWDRLQEKKKRRLRRGDSGDAS